MSKINLKRSITKGITWELLGLIVLYFLTKSFKVSIIYVIIRIIMFPLHEILWKKTSWGKIK